MRLSIIFLTSLVLAVTGNIEARATGWLDVLFKKSESSDAESAGTLRLYSASKALVIGMDNYMARGWPKLSMGIKDAVEIAAVLKRHGFEVTVLQDLKSDELEHAFRNFFIEGGADENARLLVWYAGHGHTVKGEGYLVPVDAPAPSADVKFRSTALSLRRFGEYMREARAKHVLAIFDSCFAGTVFNTSRAAPPAAITYATRQTVRQFITSGEAEQTVSDDGTFRRLFVDALGGMEPIADSNQDGYITGAELGQFLHDKITNFTEQRQTPRWGKLAALGYDRGDFVFKTGEAAETPKGPSGSASEQVGKNVAAEAWSLIQNSEDVAVLKLFREQHGDSNPHVDSLAAQRIAMLEQMPTEPASEYPTGTGAAKRQLKGDSEQMQERSFFFPPTIGLPTALEGTLLESIAVSLEKRGVRVASEQAELGAYGVQGYFGAVEQPIGAKISFIWDVRDGKGRIVRQIKEEVIAKGSKGCAAWDCLDRDAIEKIATITSLQLSE